MTKDEILSELEKCNLKDCSIENAQIIDRVTRVLRNDLFISNVNKNRIGNLQFLAEKYITFKNMDHNPRIFKMEDGRKCIYTNHFFIVTEKYIDKEKILSGFNHSLAEGRESSLPIDRFFRYDFSVYTKKDIDRLPDLYSKIKIKLGRKQNDNLVYCIREKDYALDLDPIVVNAKYLFDICVALNTTSVFYMTSSRSSKEPIFISKYDIEELHNEDFAVLMPICPSQIIDHHVNEVIDYSLEMIR